MNEITIIILSLVGLIVGFGLSYFAGNKTAIAKIADAESSDSNKNIDSVMIFFIFKAVR